MKHGRGSLLVFSGFDATEEELGFGSTNFWLFKNNNMDKSYVCRLTSDETYRDHQGALVYKHY